MKKILILTLMLCTPLVLTGCNSSQNSDNEETIETISSEVDAEVYNPSGDIYSAGFFKCLKELTGLEFTSKTFKESLDKKTDNLPDISVEKLYSFAGKQSPAAKTIITKTVGEKFKQPSYIPENINFDGNDGGIFIYSMLFDNFKFYTPFPVITGDFAGMSGKYKYFGHFPDTRNKTAITNNKSYIESLFYASDDDFGIKIQDPERKEELLLYLTNSDASFDKIYEELKEKSEKRNDYQNQRVQSILAQYTHGVSIKFEPYYKIPFISITKLYSFNSEYAGKGVKISEKQEKIKNALSVVRIKLNNEENKNRVFGSSFQTYYAGGYSQVENRTENELYYFDRPFVLFLKKSDCDKPYFAVKIKDGKYLIKSEEKN